MSSRPSSLLVSRDLESYPTLYVAILPEMKYLLICSSLSKDHYVFCYEVLARYVEDMDIYANFKAVV